MASRIRLRQSCQHPIVRGCDGQLTIVYADMCTASFLDGLNGLSTPADQHGHLLLLDHGLHNTHRQDGFDPLPCLLNILQFLPLDCALPIILKINAGSGCTYRCPGSPLPLPIINPWWLAGTVSRSSNTRAL